LKIPIVIRQDYILYLEYFNDLFFLHTDVYRWSSKVKKHYLRELNQLQNLLNTDIYGVVEDWNNKLGKFGEKIGFKYLKDLQGNDGNLYKVYKRSLEWVR
jgi:hypothetical protein